MHYTGLHCTTLDYTALHYNTLHCTVECTYRHIGGQVCRHGLVAVVTVDVFQLLPVGVTGVMGVTLEGSTLVREVRGVTGVREVRGVRDLWGHRVRGVIGVP